MQTITKGSKSRTTKWYGSNMYDNNYILKQKWAIKMWLYLHDLYEIKLSNIYQTVKLMFQNVRLLRECFTTYYSYQTNRQKKPHNL